MPNTKKYSNHYLNATDKQVIRVGAYTLGTMAVGSLLFFAGRFFYRKTVSYKEQNQSLTDNSDANFAKRLKMAFENDGWWGTDVEAVRKVFVELSDKELFTKIIKSYKQLYQRNLIEDLTDELTTTEYYEMQNILSAKPSKTGVAQNYDNNKVIAYAKRLNSAVNYKVMGMPSTDEDAIKQVLKEIPTQRIWNLTKIAYQQLYGVSLESDLNNDLGVFDFNWRATIQQKPIS